MAGGFPGRGLPCLLPSCSPMWLCREVSSPHTPRLAPSQSCPQPVRSAPAFCHPQTLDSTRRYRTAWSAHGSVEMLSLSCECGVRWSYCNRGLRSGCFSHLTASHPLPFPKGLLQAVSYNPSLPGRRSWRPSREGPAGGLMLAEILLPGGS